MNSEILAELIPNVVERVAFMKERNNHFENEPGTSAVNVVSNNLNRYLYINWY